VFYIDELRINFNNHLFEFIDDNRISFIENYGVIMLHSLFEHWSVTKQALGRNMTQ
jgi:hypothetical protein